MRPTQTSVSFFSPRPSGASKAHLFSLALETVVSGERAAAVESGAWWGRRAERRRRGGCVGFSTLVGGASMASGRSRLVETG